MIVNLPLKLTDSGNPGYMYQNYVDLIYANGEILRGIGTIDSNITIRPFFMEMSSGYDNNNNRITNIVGCDGINLLKYCPRCQCTKPTTEFGFKGRVTTSRRDQSECNSCRGSY